MSMDALIMALSRRGYETRQKSTTSNNQVRLMGRVDVNQTRGWLVVAHYLIKSAKQMPWFSVDISKSYIDRNDRLMFGWRIILQGEDIVDNLDKVAQVIERAPRARVELEEQILPGARKDRNAPSSLTRGKGAQNAGSAIVGPMAAARMGGR